VTTLKTLLLEVTSIDDAGLLAAATNNSNLRNLCISECENLEKMEGVFTKLTNLNSLEIADLSVDASVLEDLKSATNITAIDFSDTSLSDAQMSSFIDGHPFLQKIICTNSNFSSLSAHSLIATCTSLKLLDISDCEVPPESLLALVNGCSKLTELTMPNLPQEVLAAIPQSLTNLVTLSLVYQGASDAAQIEMILGMPRLKMFVGAGFSEAEMCGKYPGVHIIHSNMGVDTDDDSGIDTDDDSGE
jgi:hypothetical protein